ncbi:MAG TPA: septal ring lytic transglycosylase RlpA family protein [Rhizomicrobium sp.]|nr:septal ring lytic transglycosylase RlpA family protein [Rhizomicrobium sp.]
MFRTTRSVLAVALFSGLAAACASSPPPEGSISGSTGTAPYRVGKPYQIGDNWYYPREQPEYDEIGVASWYGPTFYGKQTASGEIYDGESLTAAHRTLPLPVNVRVTNLDNGKSVVLRVNDRGPFAKGRIIDVSKHAAELLGFYAKGTARVRVTYLGRGDVPSEPTDDSDTALAQAFRRVPSAKVEAASVRTATRAGSRPVQVASLDPPPLPAERSKPAEQPEASFAPDSARDESSGPAAAHLYVQAGTFSSEANAERLQARLAEAGLFISPTERNGRALYRVRSGPYDDLESANAALAKLAELGNNGAQIVVDR